MKSGRTPVTAGVLVVVALILGSCGSISEESTASDPETEQSTATQVKPTHSASEAPSDASSSPTPDGPDQDDPPLPSDSESEPFSGDSVAMRAQFGAYEGGDVIDPCGLNDEYSEPTVDPPFFGDEATYYGVDPAYREGLSMVWCIDGFEPDRPINVEIIAPTGNSNQFQVTLNTTGGVKCRSVLDVCFLDDYRHLMTNAPPSHYKIQSSFVRESLAGALTGYVLPGSPVGTYDVIATQGNLETTSYVKVEEAREPALEVFTYQVGDGEVGHAALLVGFPDDSIPLYIYELTDKGNWRLTDKLAEVSVQNGHAIYDFSSPSHLSTGEYCILTPHTLPEDDSPMEQEDPCWWLTSYSGRFHTDEVYRISR